FDSPISGASLRLQYPAAALKLDNPSSHHLGAIVPANAVALWNLSPNQNDYVNQDGTISLAVSTDGNWPTNNGTIAEFTFTVQSAATNQYLWPISVTAVELSSAFNLVSRPGGKISFFGRDAVPSILGGSFNAKDGKFEISFSGESNVPYRVDVSDDLKTWS